MLSSRPSISAQMSLPDVHASVVISAQMSLPEVRAGIVPSEERAVAVYE
jgi:hypothetical protein